MIKRLHFILRNIGLLIVVFLLNTTAFGQSIGDFRSKAVGPSEWATIASWETYNGTIWVAATSYPGQNAGSNTVTIQVGHTINISSNIVTLSMGTVVVDGNLNLGESSRTRDITLNTPLLSVSSTGKLNFLGQKTALRLPANAVLEVISGGDIVGACSNNTEIYIGGNLIAACVGGGSGSITFDDIVNSGGTLSANITLPSANPTYICFGQSVNLLGKFDGSATNVTYNWIVLDPNNQTIAIPNNSGALLNNTVLTTPTSFTPILTGTYLVSLKVTYGTVSNIKTKTIIVNANLPSVNSGKWLGSFNSDWFDCRNWEDGVIPTNNINVIILSTSSNVLIDANSPKAPADKIARAGNLTIETGKSLSMTNAANLFVGGNWTNNGTFSPGDGTVTFNGSLANQYQSISKTETFYNLTLNTSNNAKGLNVADGLGLFVNNNLNLTSGDIRLFGKSQLIQTKTGVSTNAIGGTGNLWRDQQGQSNIYNYNYWSSPVWSAISGINTYSVDNVFKDGTDSLNPKNITWVNGNDGAPTNPISLSHSWIYKFINRPNDYNNWTYIGQNGNLLSGEGFTMKGSGATATTQNYTFVGKPNDGLITRTINANNLYLTGNPYPSALNAIKFIEDNETSITGSLYFWISGANTNHLLSTQKGAYKVFNLTGFVDPSLPPPVGLISYYIPVGQGFYVYGKDGTNGTIKFDNTQRAFVKENETTSNPLFRTTSKKSSEENYQKIRIGFKTDVDTDFHRQLLIGFMNELASDKFDSGYDAIQIDTQKSDSYFTLDNQKLVIQGNGYFSENTIIPMGVRVEYSEKIIFTLDGVENVNPTQAIFIFDNVTQQYYNLRTNAAEITLTKGTYDNRFSLRFNNEKIINTTEIKPDIRVFYSPTTGILNVHKQQYESTIKSVALYNILGQMLAHWEVTNQQQTFEFVPNNLKPGVYLVKIKADTSEITQKIIVE